MHLRLRTTKHGLIVAAGLCVMLAGSVGVSTAAPPEANQQSRVQRVDVRADRSRMTLTLEQQVADLQQRVRDLERELGRLRNARTAQSDGQATQALAARLTALENVLRISPTKVELIVPKNLEIRSGQKLEVHSGLQMDLLSSTVLRLSGTGVTNIDSPAINLNAGNVGVDGVLRSPTAIHDSVISASYTPGAGNIW